MTEDGLVGVSTLTVSQEDHGVCLVEGIFSGLAILAAGSECPLIVTTSTTSEASYLEVIG